MDMRVFVWGHLGVDFTGTVAEIRDELKHLRGHGIDALGVFTYGFDYRCRTAWTSEDYRNVWSPGSKTFFHRTKIKDFRDHYCGRDYLADLCEANGSVGLAIHATHVPWIVVNLEQNARYLQKGLDTDWLAASNGLLCPSFQEVRDVGLELLKELLEYPIIGVCGDYLRYSSGTFPCYCSACQTLRRTWLSGTRVGKQQGILVNPDASLPRTPVDPAEDITVHPGFIYNEIAMRTRIISEFLKASVELTHAAGKKYGVYTQAGTLDPLKLGQDWVNWTRSGLVDYAIPSNYTADLLAYRRILREDMSLLADAPVPVYMSVCKQNLPSGETLPTQKFRLQIDMAMETGCSGIMIFLLSGMLGEDFKAVKKAKEFWTARSVQT